MLTYLQQYGKERTGTNYLKALIGRNFSNVVLFDNRLGSKHDHHRTVRTWMAENSIAGRDDFERLLRTNDYWRTRNVPSIDPFEGVHRPVRYEELLALRDNVTPMHYVVSIKDPYAFALSINRWQRSGLRHFHEAPLAEPIQLGELKQQCIDFNRVYRSYWPLIENGHALLASFEDLIADPSGILLSLEREFHLLRMRPEFVDIPETVAPSIGISRAPFYKTFYSTRAYMKVLSAEARTAVLDNIDWDLMAKFRYYPERAPDVINL